MAGYENVAQATGASFYAAMCFLYQSNFLEIARAGAPPYPPPSPAPPLLNGRLIIPVRIFFAGGFHSRYTEAQKSATGRVTGAGETNEEVEAEERGSVFRVSAATEGGTLRFPAMPNPRFTTPYSGRVRKLDTGPGEQVNPPPYPPVQLGEETAERTAEYVDVETSSTVIEACSDDQGTVCQTAASDQTWMKVRVRKAQTNSTAASANALYARALARRSTSERPTT